jgi:signal transduction histidine kinase
MDPSLPAPVAVWTARVLRTPLLTKLVLADLVVNAAAFLALQWTPAELAMEVTFGSLLAVLVLNAALVAIALRPLAVLEETARRVSEGEATARAHLPAVADRNLTRIAATLNALLDHVEAERQRVRTLTVAVVAAGDRERAHIARELHDGIAQSLSAVDMLIATPLADADAVQQRMTLLRDIVRDALVEVRALSHDVHPRVLDDLGLSAALHQLGRRIGATSSARIEVEAEVRELPPAVTSVVYRVAQEATHNAAKHARAKHITVRVAADASAARLEVTDDGIGFDRADAERERRGIGLFVMEERVVLLDGVFAIDHPPGGGTRVTARIPLTEAS